MTVLSQFNTEKWEGDIPYRPLKVVVIREEFVALTGDPLIAVVLNQLFYWTQRVKDFDLLLEEEKNFNPECNVSPRYGWIYKTADGLIEETMLRVSRSTMRRYLTFLTEEGWVEERKHPTDRWKKTTQYRLNLRKLQDDLIAFGYGLPGFTLREFTSERSPSKGLSLDTREGKTNHPKPAETSKFQNETSNGQNETSEFQNETSNVTNCSFIYLNRDYPETINRDHTQNVREFKKIPVKGKIHQAMTGHSVRDPLMESQSKTVQSQTCLEQTVQPKAVSEIMAEIWKKHVGQEVIHLTKDRERQLKLWLRLFFDDDLQKWEHFCERVKSSPFLMGQGPNKWHVNFGWILSGSNLLKILEGNYDNPEVMEQKREEESKKTREKRTMEVLESIEDPVWKDWCTQLKDQMLWFELKEIANAKFIEFDGRLVWIGSQCPRTLSKIEDFRLNILSVIEKTFPKVRNIRTRREEQGNCETIYPLIKGPVNPNFNSEFLHSRGGDNSSQDNYENKNRRKLC